MDLSIGKKLKGTVTGIQPYGIFVQLDKETQGLVHISEIKHGFIDNIEETVKEGDEVDVVVLDIDEYTHKISLSIRALKEPVYTKSEKKRYHPRYGNLKSNTGFSSIEEKMPRWIDESLDYIKHYKKMQKNNNA